GPPVSLYVQGKRLEKLVPVVPLTQGVGLAFAILSYCDTLTIGITADPALVPNSESLCDLLQAGFDELRVLAGVERAERRGPVRRVVAGGLVAAESGMALGADGRPDECLPGVGAGLAAWAAGRGFRVHAGPLVASPVVLDTAAAKAALGATGALAVEMESGALAAAARARGVPFAALRAVLDAAGEALPAGADVIDDASGEVRAARALAAIALRPRL